MSITFHFNWITKRSVCHTTWYRVICKITSSRFNITRRPQIILLQNLQKCFVTQFRTFLLGFIHIHSAGNSKAGMVYSVSGWMLCAGKTVKSIENACPPERLMVCSRRGAIQIHVYLTLLTLPQQLKCALQLRKAPFFMSWCIQGHLHMAIMCGWLSVRQ